jgi:hypothetical protein
MQSKIENAIVEPRTHTIYAVIKSGVSLERRDIWRHRPAYRRKASFTHTISRRIQLAAWLDGADSWAFEGRKIMVTFALANFSVGAGGWSSDDLFPREVGDVNGDGRDDVVGFGSGGTWVALGNTNGTFGAPIFALANFSVGAGGWSSDDLFPREVGDVNGDGRDDVVGFGSGGTWVALGTASGDLI